MSYINTDWLDDEHIEYLVGKFDLTSYLDAVDRKMNAVAVKLLVPVPDIPTDDNGYVTSLPFQEYGIILLKMKILGGYWGKRTGSKDIYYHKKQDLMNELADAKKDLSRESIIGPSEEDTEPADPFGSVRMRPY